MLTERRRQRKKKKKLKQYKTLRRSAGRVISVLFFYFIQTTLVKIVDLSDSRTSAIQIRPESGVLDMG